MLHNVNHIIVIDWQYWNVFLSSENSLRTSRSTVYWVAQATSEVPCIGWLRLPQKYRVLGGSGYLSDCVTTLQQSSCPLPCTFKQNDLCHVIWQNKITFDLWSYMYFTLRIESKELTWTRVCVARLGAVVASVAWQASILGVITGACPPPNAPATGHVAAVPRAPSLPHAVHWTQPSGVKLQADYTGNPAYSPSALWASLWIHPPFHIKPTENTVLEYTLWWIALRYCVTHICRWPRIVGKYTQPC